MSKPKSLKYPQDLIEKEEETLASKLHRIVRKVRAGSISKPQARREGHNALDESYIKQIRSINKVVEEKGLIGITGKEKEPLEALAEAKEAWTGVIKDI